MVVQGRYSFENRMLNEKKPDTKGHTLYDFICMKHWKNQIHRDKNRLVIVQFWGVQEQGVAADGYVASFWCDDNGEKLDCGNGCTTW